MATAVLSHQATAVGSRLEVRQVHKSFGPREVLRGVSLTVEPGEFVAIVGRSGCGKSTLLRLIAGLEQPTRGAISVPKDSTRLMFQEARLLPWKRVRDNVALGLSPGPASRETALRTLAQVGLADREGDWPEILSGGQRQRVALARALASAPRLLLLDEPLGALDALTRIEMQNLITSLWQQHKFTALLVTHDIEEAITLADRVILIEDGCITETVSVDVPRPRRHGDSILSRLSAHLLQRVLGTNV